jgi:hypothetical protein
MIVGLAGKARSGKDTVAERLITHHGYVRRAFADPMRAALYALDPYVATRGGTYSLRSLVDRQGWDQAKALPDVRRLLQRFGTEVGRAQFGEDFWVDQAVRGVAPGDLVAYTDVRFANEAAAVRDLGGIVVEVQRPGAGLAGNVAAHASEHMDFDADVVLVNDGTLEDLWRSVDALVGQRTSVAS